MKILKKITIVLVYTLTLTVTNCFAMTQDSEQIVNKDGTEYVYRNYSILQKEESNFLNELPKEITLQEKKYTFPEKTVDGGNEIETKQNTKSKKITSNTNNKEKLLNELGLTEEYKDNEGYTGEYYIDENSLKIIAKNKTKNVKT